MPSFILSLFFFSMSAYSVEVKVPSFLSGVKEHKPFKRGHFYQYNVTGVLEPKQIEVKWFDKRNTIETLVSSLLYCYKNNDVEKFKTLFTPKVQNTFKEMGQEAFDKTWKFYLAKKNTYLDFYFTHKNGTLIGLKSEGERANNLQFAVKQNNQWIFDYFEADENDVIYHNVGLWLAFRPMKYQPASLVSFPKTADQQKILIAQAQSPFVSVFAKTAEGWFLLGVSKDNDDQYSNFPDMDKAKGIVKMDISGAIEENKNYEIFVLDSSFPPTYFPKELAAKGQFGI